MKNYRILGLLLVLGLLFMGSHTVYAADTTWQNDYEYTLDGTSIILTKYRGNATNLTVPATATVGGIDYTTYINNTVPGDSYVSIWRDSKSVKSISFAPNIELGANLRALFADCKNLTSIDISNLNTKNVTNMEGMFVECSSLTNVNLKGIDVSNVVSMFEMFKNCSSLESIDLSGLNTGKVQHMEELFDGCTSLKSVNLSGFKTNSVINMRNMFQDCCNLTSLNLSGFNTSKVGNMSSMFQNCSSITSLNLSNFNTSNVLNMYSMFDNCCNLTSLNLTGFNTSKVGDMGSMFRNCNKLENLDVRSFATSNVYNIKSMFAACHSLSFLDLSNFDLRNVAEIDDSFLLCLNLTSFNTPKNLLQECPLMTAFYDSSYNFYTTLPMEQSSSITLKKGPADASSATLTIADQTYTGNALTPEVIVKLGSKTISPDSYTLKYDNNIKPGQGKVTATFSGNFKGTVSGTFNINHTHTPVVLPAVAATTSHTGLTEGKKCSICGEILVGQKVLPKIVIDIDKKKGDNGTNKSSVLVGGTVHLKPVVKNANLVKVQWSFKNKKMKKYAKLKKVKNSVAIKFKKNAKGKKIVVKAVITYSDLQRKSVKRKTVLYTFKVVNTVIKKMWITGETTIKVGGHCRLKCKISPSKASKGVVWKSSNPAIATVSKKGIVKAFSKGTVIITCCDEAGSGYRASKKIMIK